MHLIKTQAWFRNKLAEWIGHTEIKRFGSGNKGHDYRGRIVRKMRRIGIALIILLAFTLPISSCGVTHGPPVHVYCMGDSVTEGVGAVTTTYPAALDSLLNERYAVYNCGVGGQITSQMIARFSDNITSLSAPGDYAIIWGGHNDALAGIDNLTIIANLQAMYDTAHRAGLKVVALTLSPIKDFCVWTPAAQIQLAEVNAWIRTNPTPVDYVIDAHILLQDPSDHDSLLEAYDSGDHAHLNDAGYQVVADAIFNTVWPNNTSLLHNTGYAPYIKVNGNLKVSILSGP